MTLHVDKLTHKALLKAAAIGIRARAVARAEKAVVRAAVVVAEESDSDICDADHYVLHTAVDRLLAARAKAKKGRSKK